MQHKAVSSDDWQAACAANGITLYADGTALCYEPRKPLPAELLATLKSNRPAIMAWLAEVESVFDRGMEAREYWGAGTHEKRQDVRPAE